ncbi:hypothetical protein JR316_0002656 [Psilocybe cubensis]|uniref:Uncharacterized protein n=2 Tax=Psilocybe cubensis TaxID=181762 RepID=A0A8H7Y8N6_PSICU|nr:hypothetical protein JR316_0002656 [Psilocybe cubensis]KAH9485741.1 hypothetical protein JR316_0002656 [Psilocybe cubensis]
MAAETSFELPLSSDTLFLLSRGDRLDGTVKVETSRYQASGFASVHVLMRYWFPTAVERTKACLVSRGINEDGVGLFAPVYRIPGRPGWDYQLSFEITVTLPENAALNPLVIKNFETDVPNGRHDIADIGSRVLFETISLKGTNAGFESKNLTSVQSLTAQHGYIYTTNGRISGKFSTNDTLRLVTSDGRITANVDLQSDSATARPKLEAITKDGRIETDINLISRVNGGRGGSFDVVTTTKDAQLDVKFPKSPVDSTLNFIASTKDARASVTLNPAYEGTFDLHTSSHSKVNIDLFQGVDPAGKNRDRHIAFTHQNNNEFVGRVSWDPRNSYRGSVVVRTNAALYARI